MNMSRPYLLKTPCLTDEALCSQSSLSEVDRWVVPLDNENANHWSTWTQNAAGVVAAVTPMALQAAGLVAGTASPLGALAAAGTDLVLLIETTLWNGSIMETFRVLVQRPRPFVYRDVVHASGAPAHYTSFYSGHTSFAAAAMTALLLILIARGASLSWLVPSAVLAFTLTFFTGFFRVWAGKHFFTDVLVGAFAGFVVAVIVAWTHRGASFSGALSPPSHEEK
jgi:membrane-associated phospholipid phosphatase